MRRIDFFTGLIFIALGVFVVLIAPSQSPEGQKYGLPPAALPVMCGSLIIFLSVLLTFQSRKGQVEVENEEGVVKLESIPNLILYAGIAVIGIVIMDLVGFIVGGIFLIAANMVINRHPSIVGIVSYSLITPVVLYYAIFYGLRIPLP